MYHHPDQYFNGTEPPNVQGWVNHCDLQDSNCHQQPSRDSYIWYDELHPSEQTSRIIGEKFVDVVKGKSQYATYYAG